MGGKSGNKYECQPIVSRPEKDDEEEEVNDEGGKKSWYRLPYSKAKLVPPNNNENELPPFRLFDRKDDGSKEDIQLDKFGDAVKHMRHMAKHRVILETRMIYAMKTNSGGDKRKYGVTVKLVAAECTNKG